MVELVLFLKFIFATAGVTYIVTQSVMMRPFRNLFDVERNLKFLKKIKTPKIPWWVHVKIFFFKMFNCALCFGMWAGIGIYYLMKAPQLEWFLYAMIGSIWSWIIYVHVNYED